MVYTYNLICYSGETNYTVENQLEKGMEKEMDSLVNHTYSLGQLLLSCRELGLQVKSHQKLYLVSWLLTNQRYPFSMIHGIEDLKLGNPLLR